MFSVLPHEYSVAQLTPPRPPHTAKTDPSPPSFLPSHFSLPARRLPTGYPNHASYFHLYPHTDAFRDHASGDSDFYASAGIADGDTR